MNKPFYRFLSGVCYGLIIWTGYRACGPEIATVWLGVMVGVLMQRLDEKEDKDKNSD